MKLPLYPQPTVGKECGTKPARPPNKAIVIGHRGSQSQTKEDSFNLLLRLSLQMMALRMWVLLFLLKVEI